MSLFSHYPVSPPSPEPVPDEGYRDGEGFRHGYASRDFPRDVSPLELGRYPSPAPIPSFRYPETPRTSIPAPPPFRDRASSPAPSVDRRSVRERPTSVASLASQRSQRPSIALSDLSRYPSGQENLSRYPSIHSIRGSQHLVDYARQSPTPSQQINYARQSPRLSQQIDYARQSPAPSMGNRSFMSDASVYSQDYRPVYAHDKEESVMRHSSSSSYSTDRTMAPPDQGVPSWRRPRTWGKRRWSIFVLSIISLAGGMIVGGILGNRAAAYPDYKSFVYKAGDVYHGDSFFDNFEFFTAPDPSHGFVQYVDWDVAAEAGLIAYTEARPFNAPPPPSNDSTSNDSTSNGSTLTKRNPYDKPATAILRVDAQGTNATNGRQSVRISSNKTYTEGLFLFDVWHAPVGCGLWPALWLLGPQWPQGGEIDVVEWINHGDAGNRMSLHTSKGCKIGKHRRRHQTGHAVSHDCFVGHDNSGCGVLSAGDASFGRALNSVDGGIYALEVRKDGIRVWFFRRSFIPEDVAAAMAFGISPEPQKWGTPVADFPNLECDIGQHFQDMKIVLNIALCGDWAGQQDQFLSDPMCEGTCTDWVARGGGDPGAWDEAYWEIGGFYVFERSY